MQDTLSAAFLEFRKQVRESVLYKRTYGYYAAYLTLVLIGIALSVLVLVSTTNFFVQMANAVFLSFVLVQGGMFGHDLAHQQVFVSKKKNLFFSSLAWGLFGGLSAHKWFEKHNAHHKYTNQVGRDPDLDIPFIFSEHQIPAKQMPLMRFPQRHQHIIFFLLLPFVYMNMVVQTYLHIFKRFSVRTVAELGLIVAHFVVLMLAIFLSLPVVTSICFLVVHFMCVGVYMSLVFAPNHKGRPILAEGETGGWLDQIRTTRNIYASKLVFHIFGGLNFQIEHHLFSDMARPQYFKVQKLVREFCARHNISYHETSWLGSLREIYQSLKRNSGLSVSA